MKSYIIIPFVFILGLLIGAWQPRAQVAQLNKELETTKDALEANVKGDRRRLGVTGVLGIDQFEPASSPKKSSSAAVAVSNEVLAAEEDNNPSEEDGNTKKEEDSPAFDLDAAIDAWKVRVELARSSFIANADLNAEQTMLFDQSIDGMNLAIGSTIDFFADRVEQDADVDSEVACRILDAVLSSVVTTYDTIDEFAPDGWRAEAGENFDLLNFIDPEVARPLVELDDFSFGK